MGSVVCDAVRVCSPTNQSLFLSSSSTRALLYNAIPIFPHLSKANFTAMIGRASAAAADIVLMTEEDFGGGDANGEPIDGPGGAPPPILTSKLVNV